MKYYMLFIVYLALNGCLSLDLRPLSQRPISEFTIMHGRSDQKIAIIDLSGTISTQPTSGLFDSAPSLVQEFLSRLDLAARDVNVKAILLRISSPGGSSVASELLYNEIKRFKNLTHKKILSYSTDISASGAYYAAIAGDYIMAYPHSMVGSIGAVYVRPEIKDLTDKIGVKFHTYKSGDKKDMGTFIRPPTPEESRLSQKTTDILGKNFLDQVLRERQIKDPDKVKKIASAQVFLAEESKSLGLIDEVGSIYQALDRLKNMASLSNNAQIVTYRRAFVANDHLYNTSFASPRFVKSPEHSSEKLIQRLLSTG